MIQLTNDNGLCRWDTYLAVGVILVQYGYSLPAHLFNKIDYDSRLK